MLNFNKKEDKFFALFEDTARVIDETAELLASFMNDLSDSKTKIKEFEDLEHKGDDQTHTILAELNKSFITPVDREDIFAIAKGMDDIVDFIDSAANRFVMFNVRECTPISKQIGELIVKCSKELLALTKELHDMKKSSELTNKIIAINTLEHEGDILFRQAVTALFTGEVATLEVIKWKEIYELLEKVLDAYEDVADTIEGVVMKHA